MRGSERLGPTLGVLAVLFSLVSAIDVTTSSSLVAAVVVVLLTAATATVVPVHRVGGVGPRRGETPALLPVLSSRLADPVHHPVRPRAPGLV